MNTQTGKSVGIALLLAAGLLAALFAMGVFAPAGVDALVKGGAQAPKVTLSDPNPGATNVTMTITFEVNDGVDNAPAEDNVSISIPNGTAASEFVLPAGFNKSNVSVMQDGVSVGTVTLADSDNDPTNGITPQTVDDDTIVIGPAASGGTNLAANKLVTVEITGLSNPTSPASVDLMVGQQNSATDAAYIDVTATARVINTDNALQNVSADVSPDFTGATGVEMTISFTTPTGAEQVVIELPLAYDALLDGSGATTGLVLEATNVTVANLTYTASADPVGDIITVPATELSANETVTITIKEDAVDATTETITNPSTAEEYTVKFRQGTVYPELEAKFETIVEAGKATLSSMNAGADVGLTVKGNAGRQIRGGREISVSLPGFGVPGSIDENNVIIDGIRDGSYYGNPSDVTVSGTKITITVPARDTNEQGGRVEAKITPGFYEIIFKGKAGLSNPTSRGMKTITVSDADATDEKLMVDIASSISLKPTSVSRGDAVVVTGKGLSGGSATVYLEQDGTDVRLDSGATENNTVSVEIDTASSKFKAGSTHEDGDTSVKGLNNIYIIDASGHMTKMATLLVGPKVSVDVSDVKRSGKMKISVSDWFYGDITKVTIGGIEVMQPDGDDAGSADDEFTTKDVDSTTRKASFDVIVPRSARLGEQQVVVTGTTRDMKGNPSEDDDPIDSVMLTVNVGTFSLTVNPDTAVTDQVIRIEGAGFGERTCITSVMVGEQPITEATNGDDIGDGDDCVKTDSNGELSSSFKVPGKLAAGTYTLEVRDANNRVGDAELTIPKPMIELTPTSSQRGDTVTVVGSNFPAEDLLTITYGGDTVTVATTDTRGNWRATFEVPVDATIGREHDVIAQSEKKADGQEGRVSLNAKAKHRVPDETLMISPAEVSSGGRLTVTAGNLPLFTPVSITIGGIGAAGRVIGEDDASDGSGRYEKVLLVPQLTPGSHIVELTVHTVGTDVVVAKFVDILDIVTRPTAEVFEDLIAANQLTVVWRYDNATASWASYDPTAPAELNDLNLVSTDDIVWVQLTAAAEFQGRNLNAGWSLINLE